MDRRISNQGNVTRAEGNVASQRRSGGTSLIGSSLTPGQLFLGKYRVERVLGQGGMGTVYEARDTYIGRSVALKTIRHEPDASKRERLAWRLAREARAAGRLAHPNIVLVHDAGEAEGLDYIVMELVEGVTLAELLKQRGALAPAPAVSIALQAAEALGFAHEHQVLHRDVKPSNILVGEGGRIKVADFGLALLLSESSRITRDGAAVGTAAYMSPEQIRGLSGDGRSDLFSLAAVLYECLTGAPPFDAGSLPALLYQILEAAPRPLELQDRSLELPFAAFFERALAKDRARRFPDAGVFVEALHELASLCSGAAGHAASVPARASARAVDLASYLESTYSDEHGPASRLAEPPRLRMSGTSSATPSEPGAPAAGSEPAPARSAVAVLGFKNLSGRPDAAWLSVALSEMLGTELGAGERLRVIPGEDVARMKLELALPEADSYSKQTLACIRANIGARFVVLGSFLAMPKQAQDRLRLDLRLQDAEQGETVASLAETGVEHDLFELVPRVGARLRQMLEARADRAAADGPGVRGSQIPGPETAPHRAPGILPQGRVRGSLPWLPEAARFYSQGLTRLRLFDAQGARGLLHKAAALEPQHPLIHWALAEAWERLGYAGAARGEARRAFELSRGLPREERLSIEARHREMSAEWDQALEIYQTLWDFFPDSIDYGLRLAEAQIRAGRRREAFGTVQALRRLPQPLADDPRIDVLEMDAARQFGDSRRQRAAAARAAEKGGQRGALLLVARARVGEGLALVRLGEPEPAAAAYEEARRLYATAEDSMGVATALRGLAELHAQQGDADRARTLGEEALRICREIGDKSGLARTLGWLTLVLEARWDLPGALGLLEEALETYREIDSGPDVVATLMAIARLLRQQGERHAAEARLLEALALARESGAKLFEAAVLNELAITLASRGKMDEARPVHAEAAELFEALGAADVRAQAVFSMAHVGLWPGGWIEEALRLYRDSLAALRELGQRSWVAHVLFRSAPARLENGDLAGARAQYDEALAIGTQLREADTVAIGNLGLAELQLEAGQAQEAEAAARTAGEALGRAGRTDGEALGHVVLARALLALGRLAEAQQAIERARSLYARNADLGRRYSAEVVAARIRAAREGPADRLAREGLERAIEEAAEAGFLGPQLEARLALGELELEAGELDAGCARLGALEREAVTRGFGLIAGKTGRALRAAADGEARRP
jgi:eukaryotic-like serine/threonine-protein kinase